MKSLLRRVPRLVLVLAALVAFGFVRAPVEDHLRERLVESNLLLPPPGRGALEQMTQSALMGTLGGLRSLVAFYFTLIAYDQFGVKAWEELHQTYQIITSLEPREEANWVALVWHLGINATASVQFDEDLPPFERERRFQEYAFEAIAEAERGLEQLPESVDIRVQLAEVYREKLKDPCATARVFGEAMDLPGALGYIRRFHGYFLADCPGKEREAYDFLTKLYRQSEQQRLPTMIVKIKQLEQKLDIPLALRIPEDDPDRPRRPGVK